MRKFIFDSFTIDTDGEGYYLNMTEFQKERLHKLFLSLASELSNLINDRTFVSVVKRLVRIADIATEVIITYSLDPRTGKRPEEFRDKDVPLIRMDESGRGLDINIVKDDEDVKGVSPGKIPIDYEIDKGRCN